MVDAPAPTTVAAIPVAATDDAEDDDADDMKAPTGAVESGQHGSSSDTESPLPLPLLVGFDTMMGGAAPGLPPVTSVVAFVPWEAWISLESS